MVSAAAAAGSVLTVGSTAGLWHALIGPLPDARAGHAADVQPAAFRAFTLDRSGMQAALAKAPPEAAGRARPAVLPVISLPRPSGGFERFRVQESPVMEPQLAAEHPEIKTYDGRGIDDPATSVRLDLTPLGFHASVRGADGSWYIDPYYHLSQSVYVTYRGDALPSTSHGTFTEGEPLGGEIAPLPPAGTQPGPAVGSQLRTYRLALASDPSYFNYFGGVDANVTAAKVTLLNRVTQIYEDETSIRLMLVGNNDALNFDTPAQFAAAGYTATQCDDTMLQQNQTALTAAIGTANFDIGHIVLGADGGGLAGLGVVGSASQKAWGCTGIPDPVGDQFAVDYVAHEMGHEFGADHSFNGYDSACGGGNRNQATSVEPGSGSSIMAYAGICGSDDLQPHSDPYFSGASFDEIVAYTSAVNANSPGNQGTVTQTGNSPPVVTTDAGPFTIPTRTPFALTGRATDANSDTLTYLWEQLDPGTDSTGTHLTTGAKTNGPLFRQFSTPLDSSAYTGSDYNSAGENHPTTDPTRVFPDMAQILANNTDANTGACPGGTLSVVECDSEWLPTSVYPGPMHFRLTARDDRPGGGGVASAATQVNVATAAGPFLVTSPNTAVTYQAGSASTITWNVANTDQAPVNTADVDILLSTDGGQTFTTTLAAATPNDGSQTVVLPNVSTTQARIEIRAVGNIYFDVSDANFTITAAPQRTLTVTESGTGTGTVVSDPAGISCPGTCSHAFADGTVVTLTATPSAGSSFDGWTDGCSGDGSCQLTLSADTTATAGFTQKDASRLTIGKSVTLGYGTPLTVRTQLTDSTSGAPIGDATLTLFQQRASGSSWTEVTSTTTTTTGAASTSVTPKASTRYQWRYAGSATVDAATSPTQSATVAQVVSARGTARTVKSGAAVKIYGTVKPSSTGATVYLQRLSGTKWRTVANVKTKRQRLPDGTSRVGYVFSVTPTTKGTLRYRTFKPATAALAKGVSPTIRLKVT